MQPTRCGRHSPGSGTNSPGSRPWGVTVCCEPATTKKRAGPTRNPTTCAQRAHGCAGKQQPATNSTRPAPSRLRDSRSWCAGTVLWRGRFGWSKATAALFPGSTALCLGQEGGTSFPGRSQWARVAAQAVKRERLACRRATGADPCRLVKVHTAVTGAGQPSPAIDPVELKAGWTLGGRGCCRERRVSQREAGCRRWTGSRCGRSRQAG